jgi:hypothetical protein
MNIKYLEISARATGKSERLLRKLWKRYINDLTTMNGSHSTNSRYYVVVTPGHMEANRLKRKFERCYVDHSNIKNKWSQLIKFISQDEMGLQKYSLNSTVFFMDEFGYMKDQTFRYIPPESDVYLTTTMNEALTVSKMEDFVRGDWANPIIYALFENDFEFDTYLTFLEQRYNPHGTNWNQQTNSLHSYITNNQRKINQLQKEYDRH